MDLTITPELYRLFVVRDFCSRVNALRKSGKLLPEDRVSVVFSTEVAELGSMLEEEVGAISNRLSGSPVARLTQLGSPEEYRAFADVVVDKQPVQLALILRDAN